MKEKKNNFQSRSRKKLMERIGHSRQLAGIQLSERVDGWARGLRQASFRTTSGLEFEVLLDRALDLPSLYYRGYPLAWRSPVEETHPAYYAPRDKEWLRSFFGGLLTTCGLTSFGPPCTDKGEILGLHGRVSNIPAKNVSVEDNWYQNDGKMWIQGEVRQAKVFGENLLLKRRVHTRVNSKKLIIDDEVKNLGFRPIPHMILYHINLGYPLLDEEAELFIQSSEVQALNDQAASELDLYHSFSRPQRQYEERVYQHHLGKAKKNSTVVALFNANLLNDGLGVAIKFDNSALPYLVEWKMMGKQEYVLGLEPANCPHKKRSELREKRELEVLAAQEKRGYKLVIEVLDGGLEFERLKKCKD